MRSRTDILFAAVLCLAGCDAAPSSTPPEAQQTAAELSGDAKGDVAANPHCRMFTPAEVAEYAGKPVKSGGNAAGGSGCQWLAEDGNGSAILQVVPATYHSAPSGAPGYKDITDLGKSGFAVPESGGWAAGAIQGDNSIQVSTPAGATEEGTISFVREAMKRAAK